MDHQREADEARKTAKALQEEMESVKYTADSKNGRRLRARLQTWQKENEELAALVSEGQVRAPSCTDDPHLRSVPWIQVAHTV